MSVNNGVAMSKPTDPFDRLRQAIPDATPDLLQTQQARHALEAAIAAETHPTTSVRPSRHNTMARLAVAAVAFSVVAVSISMLISRSETAVATLQEIAQAALQAEPSDIPPGGFLFQESTERSLRVLPGSEVGVDQEFAAYILTTDRSTWRNPEVGFVQTAMTNRDPEFFDPKVEEGYASQRLADADRLDLTIIDQFTDVTDPILNTQWPDSPDDLFDAIVSAIGPTPQAEAQGHQVFDFAIDMLAEPIDPTLRATVVEVIARFTQPTSVTSLPDGSARIEYDYFDGLETRQTATIRNDGTLESRQVMLLEADTELGLPPGILVASTSYSRWEPTQELD